MKWVFAILGLVLASYFAFSPNSQNVSPTQSLPSVTAIPTPSPNIQTILLNIENTLIRISWASVPAGNVELYSNLNDKKDSLTIKNENECNVLISGGFYSQTNTHLGLFVSDYKTVSRAIQSALLSGFLRIEGNNVTISANPPSFVPRLALQTGPLLMLNSSPLTLAIHDDEPERRMIAATTEDNKLIFAAVYRDNSDLQGPLLGQLPEIVEEFSKRSGLGIVNAINLDGGSASAFLTDSVSIPEITYMGGYFCGK